MITLEKEKVTVNPDIKVIKRDGRMVTFNSSKIYEAILKANEAITPITPLIETKLEGIANRVVAEINNRFSHNIKIYEIQSIVEHECRNSLRSPLAISWRKRILLASASVMWIRLSSRRLGMGMSV